MTSRVSFYKLFKETLKRHLTAILIVVLTFIIHFIGVLMQLQNITESLNNYYDTYQFDRTLDLLSPSSLNGVIALAIGAYLAYDFFRYMHSRKESDFYDSLPYRRQDHFKLNLLCSFIIFAVISASCVALELLVANILGLGFEPVFAASLWNYVTMLLAFLVSWVTAALAMIATGNPIIALLGYGAFTIYFPILVNNLIPTFSEMYFDTYYTMPVFTKINYNALIYYLSPVTLMNNLVVFRGDFWTFADHSKYLLGAILFVLIVGFVAFKLHGTRPAESAGRAMAFETFNSIIRILIVFPIALYGGVLFKELSATNSEPWLVFGIIFTGFILHGILQAVFEFDVRAIFTKKRQLLFTYVLCLGFVAIFWLDVFNFDEYVPDESKVADVAIYVDDVVGYYDDDIHNGLSKENILLALDAANELTQKDDHLYDSSNGNFYSAIFKYELKTGKIITREYFFDASEIPVSLDKLSVQKDYKDDICILYHHDADYFTSMFYYEFYEEVLIPEEYRQELIDTYVSEYTKLSFSDHYQTPVIFTFGMNHMVEGENYEKYSSFFVYESFERTIALLNKIGCKTIADNDDIELIALEVFDDNYEQNQIINDAKLLKQLKKCISTLEYNYYDKDGEWLQCFATFDTPKGEVHYDVTIRKTDFYSIVK